jgi:hypothetical protein
MKVTLKTLVFVVALSSLLVVGAYLSWSKAKASTTKTEAAKTATAPIQYHFTNNGTVFGTDPSPIQIVQVSHNGNSITVDKPVMGAADLLDGLEVRLKNVSSQDIKFARLRVDLIDPRTNKIAVTSIGPAINTRLAPGQEQAGKALASTSESLRRSASNLGLAFQQALVQVDIVEMVDGTSWKYGLLHRQDPNDPTIWRPIALLEQQSSLNGSPKPSRGEFKVEKASARSSATVSACLCFNGYSPNPNECPYCDVYDEIWSTCSSPYGIPGPLIYHCPGGGICTKIGYTGFC